MEIPIYTGMLYPTVKMYHYPKVRENKIISPAALSEINNCLIPVVSDRRLIIDLREDQLFPSVCGLHCSLAALLKLNFSGSMRISNSTYNKNKI